MPHPPAGRQQNPRGSLPHPRASPLGWGGKKTFLKCASGSQAGARLVFQEGCALARRAGQGMAHRCRLAGVASAGFPAAFFATGINAPPGSRLSWHPRSRKHLHRRSPAKHRLNQASQKQHVNRSRFLRRQVIGKNPMVGVEWLLNDQQVPCPGAPACSPPCSTLGT